MRLRTINELSGNRRFEVELARKAADRHINRDVAHRAKLPPLIAARYHSTRRDDDGPDPLFFRAGVRQAISTLQFYREPTCFGPDHPCTKAIEETLLRWLARYRLHFRLAHRVHRRTAQRAEAA